VGIDFKEATVGQIGLGAAGSSIAHLIMDYTGRPVIGSDVNPVSVERFKKLGGEVAKSIEELMKKADVVIATTGQPGLIKPEMIRKRQIILALSTRLGYCMEYDSSGEVMEEIALLSPIYGGMHHDRLEQSWGLQWPCWDRSHPGTPFLHKYYFTRGKGHFMPASHTQPGELPDSEYPLLLMTGRIYHQYHTGTMTRKSERLSRECDHAVLQINPEDAKALGLRQGETVRLLSRRGEITLAASITGQVACGMVYTTFHFHEAPINRLTNDAFDTGSRCPEYKVCAVRVEKIVDS